MTLFILIDIGQLFDLLTLSLFVLIVLDKNDIVHTYKNHTLEITYLIEDLLPTGCRGTRSTPVIM